MATAKLKLEDVAVETFETGVTEMPSGTVEANQFTSRPRCSTANTCPGQTIICSACGTNPCA
ncbi:MAG TPA: hypothetical protein VFS20_20365 [Longimicrobium sp.]|nr:hypothetical protein [Longimicrobium sp.]